MGIHSGISPKITVQLYGTGTVPVQYYGTVVLQHKYGTVLYWQCTIMNGAYYYRFAHTINTVQCIEYCAVLYCTCTVHCTCTVLPVWYGTVVQYGTGTVLKYRYRTVE